MNRNNYGTYLLDPNTTVRGMYICDIPSRAYANYMPRMSGTKVGALILTTNGELVTGTVRNFSAQPVEDDVCNACMALGMKIIQFMQVIGRTLGGNANPQVMSQLKMQGNALEGELRNFQKLINNPKTGITSKALKQLLDEHKLYSSKTFFVDVEHNNIAIWWHTEITRKYTGPLRSCFSNGVLIPSVAETNRDYQIYLTGMRASKGNGIMPMEGNVGNTKFQVYDHFELSKWSTLYYRQDLRVRLAPMDPEQVQYNSLMTILRNLKFLET